MEPFLLLLAFLWNWNASRLLYPALCSAVAVILTGIKTQLLFMLNYSYSRYRFQDCVHSRVDYSSSCRPRANECFVSWANSIFHNVYIFLHLVVWNSGSLQVCHRHCVRRMHNRLLFISIPPWWVGNRTFTHRKPQLDLAQRDRFGQLSDDSYQRCSRIPARLFSNRPQLFLRLRWLQHIWTRTWSRASDMSCVE